MEIFNHVGFGHTLKERGPDAVPPGTAKHLYRQNTGPRQWRALAVCLALKLAVSVGPGLRKICSQIIGQKSGNEKTK